MKKIKYLCVAILLPFITQAQEEDKVITGNLDVLHGGIPFKGNLKVEGDVDLSTSPVDYIPDELTTLGLSSATYFGPVSIGERSKRVEFSFENIGDDDFTMTNIPLGKIRHAGKVKITATVWQSGNVEGATWQLYGSRHSEIRCSKHTAYGVARFIKLSGDMSHGHMILILDLDASLSDHRYGIEKVNIVIEAESDDIVFERVSGLEPTPITPVSSNKFITERGLTHEQAGRLSAITGEWTGTEYTFHGAVKLAEPQGDISMGEYGNPEE